jgi:hypothetical protein
MLYIRPLAGLHDSDCNQAPLAQSSIWPFPKKENALLKALEHALALFTAGGDHQGGINRTKTWNRAGKDTAEQSSVVQDLHDMQKRAEWSVRRGQD